jgi:hypothetical protein
MQLPRPLLIVVVVLIVLAVVGVGAAFAGPDGERDDAQGGLSGFLDGFIPDPDPVELNTTTAPCLNAAAARLEIALGGFCTVLVLPADTLRRELELEVLQGAVRFEVEQRVGDETPDSDPQVVPFVDDGEIVRSVSVVVSRGDSATLDLQCGNSSNCFLAVNP